jgi:Bifunctional DNA primase/polymerase, N-terminal/Primase C terminal 1 (PriCT-1)
MGEMLDAALAYAARGWHVFPCLPPDAAACRDMEPHKRGKTPACAHGKDDATTDSNIIKTWWWWENPNYNIGVRTGKESGFFVIDVDGDEGESELRKLEDQFGQLPPTLESLTGRGGRHLCFQIDSHPIRNSTSAFAPKVDVRANGGYIVAPPSLHGLGRRYAWSVDSADGPVAAPAWVIERAICAKFAAGSSIPPTRSADAWAAAFAEPIAEGTRDDTLTRITGYLLRRSVDPFVALEIVRLVNAARCVPPLPDCDLARIIESIAGKELRRRAGFGR